MAGHSKWANIKHKKERQDAKKGKLFTRAAKEIITAVKLGGKDSKSNTRLRLAIQKAKEVNMPNDNIDRLIKRASQEDQAAYEEILYEIYGHQGVGILVDVMCTNKNKIASEIRSTATKKGATVAMPGSVSFNFDKKGVIVVDKEKAFEDELFDCATQAGAEDFVEEEDGFVIFTAPDMLLKVQEALHKAGIAYGKASLEMCPKTEIECSEESQEKNEALLLALEELEDVDQTWHNMKE